jgi:phosphopantothenoylcysteine synthetase/decarboxylase
VYERKTYILGLTSAFNAEIMPPSMQTHLLRIIQQIIAMLNKLKQQEAKALQKAAKKEIKADSSDEEEYEDDDEPDYEDDNSHEEDDDDDKMQEDEEEEA